MIEQFFFAKTDTTHSEAKWPGSNAYKEVLYIP